MINGISQIVREKWMERCVKEPPHTGSYYCNYKNICCIVLMTVVNSNYEFIMADACINVRISEGVVLGNTAFGKALVDKLFQISEPGTLPNSEKKLPFVFVGMTLSQ
jgi:hypothetical protein